MSERGPTPFCFGKLEIAGDFVRGDGPAPEFGELDDWIQHGMYESQQRLGDSWQDRYDGLPPARFLWTNGEGPVLIGWWRSSRDAVGRRYPFLLGARLPRVAARDLPLVPLAMRRFFDDAAAMLDDGFDGRDLVAAIDSMQAMPCEADFEGARTGFAAATRTNDAALAWAGHDDAPELLLHDLEQVSCQSNPPQYSLRWPTRGDDVDLAFWLTAMARFGNPSPRLVLWHGANGDRSGVARAALCALQPRMFSGMIFFDRDDDDAYDMGRSAGEDARSRDARARFAATVGAGDQAAALEALPRGRS